VQTLLSGPVGGVIGGAALAEATGRPNLICVDMGGTSFDMSLIRNGKPTVTSQTYLEGLPLLMSIQEIHTIGAGGGSIGWVEAGGLRVGPQSAGADPGPACYGRGGTEPTVTDANLVLKRIGASSLLGGQMTLHEEPARGAVRKVASQLGMGEFELAEGILSVINARMADGIRTITVGRGLDPREYALVAFGGAGPMHAVWLAEELEIETVIVPNSPGAFSALGMLQADLRHDLMRSYYHAFRGVTMDDLLKLYDELVAEGTEGLRAEGIPPENMTFELTSDMRYIGQEYSVNVRIMPDMTLEQIDAAFHAAYFDRYGHSTPGAPVEFVNVRLTALGRVARKPMIFEPIEAGKDPVIEQREVIFGGSAFGTPVYKRMRMEHGSEWHGPMIVEEDTATTVIPPGYQASVDNLGNIIITVE
jgi:N-methylhydantoinase A